MRVTDRLTLGSEVRLCRSLWQTWGFAAYTPGGHGVLAVHQCVEIASACVQLRARQDPQTVLVTPEGMLAVGEVPPRWERAGGDTAAGEVYIDERGVTVSGVTVTAWRTTPEFAVRSDGAWRAAPGAAWLAGYAPAADVVVLDARRAWGGALDVVAKLVAGRAATGGLAYRYTDAG